MQTKIQFSRGNFSTFLSKAASSVDNPLPSTVIANRAAEKLLKDFDILVQPDDLTYDEGCALKDPSKNKLKPSEISNHSWRKDVVAYLKDVKCQDSDEQREVDNLIDSLLLEVDRNNNTIDLKKEDLD